MRFAVERLRSIIRSLTVRESGQVAIIFAIAAVMLFVAIGMGLDLWQAYVTKQRLQSAVDAAALAIASTDRTQFTEAQLQARVRAYVTANYPSSAIGTPGTPTLSYGATVNIINVTDTANVPTTFMRVVGINTLSVSTTGQAKAAYPNIDFYLLLDSSPSMAIPATQAGINLMISKTKGAGQQEGGDGKGCAFGCHQVNPAGDSLNNVNQSTAKTDPKLDNYGLSQQLGVKLRIDNLRTAAQDLMDTATATMATHTNAAYRMAIYTFDVAFNTIQTQTTDLVAAKAAATNIQLLTMCQNGVRLVSSLTKKGKTHKTTTLDGLPSTTGLAVGQVVDGTGIVAGSTVTAVNSAAKSVTLSTAATTTASGVTFTFYTCTNDNDQDTNYDNAMNNINTIMPDPGHGTLSPGDTPKEVLFFVTDGVEDQNVVLCTSSATVSCNGNRQMSVMDPGWCTTIKNRGIVIAILYTEYLPLPTNAWYNTYINKFQPSVATALQSCATPGLYTKVTTDGDISAALSQLFLTAVNSVYLSK